jgi:ATP-dependent DNA helicase DinG
VDLETTGLVGEPQAEILEFGALLLDPGLRGVATAEVLLRPRGGLPRAVARLTGIGEEELRGAPELAALAPALRELLSGRVLVAHNAAFERHFLAAGLGPELASAPYLDTLDLLGVVHPDAPDLRLESLTRLLLGREERHRALADAHDLALVLAAVAAGARRGETRQVLARRALERFAPESPWLPLLGKEELCAAEAAESPFVEVGESAESPVPFDEEAIAAALADEARGRRHFRGYRVRREQIELARAFARNLREGGMLLAEGGTGVGKSLAYLAAAIPFAMEREREGAREPVLISTRTRLLQDQLLQKDIAAAARFLGHAGLRALSIKGRANYVCARRLAVALAEGAEPRLLAEERLAFAVLATCARLRPHGEIGSVPAALLRRFPALRELLRRAVAARSEQCSREQCAAEAECPLGRRRAALARAHLVVANHDLLLRWPPDYPAFIHAIVDEAHELADVADDAFALEAGPEGLLERFDEIFGRPLPGGRGSGEGLLPSGVRRSLAADARAWRRALQQDLVTLGRSLSAQAGDFGEVQVPEPPGDAFAAAAVVAEAAAARLEQVADQAEAAAGETGPALSRSLAELREAAGALQLAFAESRPEAVAAFEGVLSPFDRWRLFVRPVSPAGAFHARLADRLHSFAGVSASLFVAGSAFASLGDLELEERAGERLRRLSVPSPFPYAEHMRVVALAAAGDPVLETAGVLGDLALRLGGRTLGLFTSLRRMHEVAEELAPRLRREGIDVLLPRRASDDPAALVARFLQGSAVLLGARRFWQGVDIPGDDLQAVVIEKLPFEVPTELRRRREARLEARGVSAFERYTLGRMLLNLKQMTGRLIRSEEDRGIAVIVDARTGRRYFGRVAEALPRGVRPQVAGREDLAEVLAGLGLGTAGRA